eukprot:TRINITY_DN1964_c0_g1_i2.p1 TRINITY_DN1964_c0_g1~~TRINITY_DN1964_c0_g1_i2.p1  ORF type:complete len:285 (+),score=73.74 TRINITY_DN1964_c0_g1_i2:55-855(+)
MGLGREAGETRYFPPDFDPLLVPSLKGPRKAPIVRMQMPFGLQCNECGDGIPLAKKFHAAKERVKGEDYLGKVAVFRLTIQCPRCASNISLKTDPANFDYVVEAGATRKYEHHVAEKEKADAEDALVAEEQGDTLAEHTRKVEDARREMSMLEHLEDLHHQAVTKSFVTDDQLFNATIDKHTSNEQKLKLADEEEAKAFFRRLELEKAEEQKSEKKVITQPPLPTSEEPEASDIPVVVTAKRKKTKKVKKKAKVEEPTGLGGLDYD